MVLHELRTERLLLRRWRASDLDPFSAMNSDARVMEHFPRMLTRDETAAGIEKMEEMLEGRPSSASSVYPLRPLRRTSSRVWKLAGAWPKA